MDPIQNNYNKLLVIFGKLLVEILSYLVEVGKELLWTGAPILWASSQSGMLHWVVMIASLFSFIPPLILHFDHSHFILAWTIESLNNDLALNSVSFVCKLVNSKYQIPENCKFKLSTIALV